VSGGNLGRQAPPAVPPLTGAERAVDGRARRVALRDINLVFRVTREAPGRPARSVQQVVIVNAGDVVLVSSELADAKAGTLVTEDAYGELASARQAWDDAQGSQVVEEAGDTPAEAQAQQAAELDAAPDSDGTVDASRSRPDADGEPRAARRVRRPNTDS
jgi:hypothetical protein